MKPDLRRYDECVIIMNDLLDCSSNMKSSKSIYKTREKYKLQETSKYQIEVSKNFLFFLNFFKRAIPGKNLMKEIN